MVIDVHDAGSWQAMLVEVDAILKEQRETKWPASGDAKGNRDGRVPAGLRGETRLSHRISL